MATAEDAQLLELPRRHFEVMRGFRSSEIDGLFFVRFQLTLTFIFVCEQRRVPSPCCMLQRSSVHGSGKFDENVIAVYQDGTSSVGGSSGVGIDNADAHPLTIQQPLSLRPNDHIP